MAKTLAQLHKQIETLQREAAALKAKEVEGVVARIREAIEHYGLTPADLGFVVARPKAAKGSGPAAKRARKPGRKRRAVLPPKFRGPDGQTWNGHGRRPRWFVEALAQGKKPEDMAI